MTAPFRIGQRVIVKQAYKRFGTTHLKEGAATSIVRVSETGNVIVQGHGGWFSADRFEATS